MDLNYPIRFSKITPFSFIKYSPSLELILNHLFFLSSLSLTGAALRTTPATMELTVLRWVTCMSAAVHPIGLESCAMYQRCPVISQPRVKVSTVKPALGTTCL